MKILFVGDVMLGRLVNKFLETEAPEVIWDDTLKIFQTADFRICNLECVISDKGTPWTLTPKAFHFRSDSKNVKALKVADINAVSLANNHVLDFDEEALIDMLNILHEYEIYYCGAGKNFYEAFKPALFEVEKKKFALFSFTDNEPVWEAKEEKAGVYYMPIQLKDERVKKFIRIIENAKKDVDMIIVSAHWGSNWGEEVPEEHIAFAHRLIDAGVDILFGHSAHIFRGIEIYKGSPIIYSAGNFIDDYSVGEVERNDESFIFIAEIDDRFVNLKLYPTVIQSYQAILSHPPTSGKIISRMKTLSESLGSKCAWNKKENFLKIH